MMQASDLSRYSNSWYDPGAGFLKRFLWYCFSACFFTSRFPVNGIKIFLLRVFGSRLGKGIIIKPGVNIKYPWKLSIGDYVWLGENVWIDNLAQITIGNHVCLSQGAFILCGNHDYTKSTFDLLISPVILEDGVWIGAKAIVCPGVKAGSHAVLTAGSLANKNLDSYMIYRGNPAMPIKDRILR